jgi:pyruvate/2-oxoglutarate dehydrogenase complex dihydrolipoamide acyltransferase (E2) component
VSVEISITSELIGDEDEADLSEWLVADGDEVTEGDPIARLETSKVQVDVEAPRSGRIVLLAAENDVLSLDDVIARIEP